MFTCGLAGLDVVRVLCILGLVPLFKIGSSLILARVLFTFGLASLHLARVLSTFGLVALDLALALFNAGYFGWCIVYVWLGWLTFG